MFFCVLSVRSFTLVGVFLFCLDVFDLEQMISDIVHRISQMSSHLVRQLKCRERRLTALRDKCDIVTAILHASSLKRSQ